MRIDHILIVSCEWIAFLCWAVNYTRLKETRYRLFVFYLGFLAVTELANMLFRKADNSFTNLVVQHVNVPLQFLFWFYFLLYAGEKNNRPLFFVFTAIYAVAYISERFKWFTNPVNFDSFSYGIGILLLIIAIILSLRRFFSSEQVITYWRETIFWILIGLILYYIGSFPYQNFKNYFWHVKKHEELAYLLYYISQTLNCIMYLLFAYAVRWKIK